MVTGITPQYAITHGINEVEFAKRIHEIFSIANSCILGYNNIHFDDEITRNIFYRNFYDPYAYSWQKGNSRWDLIDVLRACYTLRPNGINWPINNYGFTSFKLEDLTTANNIKHINAHDAIADVYATVEIAKLIKQAQPRVFDYFFQLRNKKKIIQLIDIITMTPLVYVSSVFGSKRANTSLIVPLAWHPHNCNIIIACDLSADIDPLVKLDSNVLKQHLYLPKTKLLEALSIPIKLIHINKCPILAPANVLREDDAQRIGLDLDICLNNLSILRKHNTIKDTVIRIFTKTQPNFIITDVDNMLYSNFFSKEDHLMMAIIRKTSPQNLSKLKIKFNDSRMNQLFFRYRARNYPYILTTQEQQSWLYYRRTKLTNKIIAQYLQTIEQLFNKYKNNKQKCKQLNDLIEYANLILN